MIKESFNDKSYETIGVAFSYLLYDNKIFEIWDTCGQERFGAICKLFYRSAEIIVLIFDVTDMSTFTRIQQLITNLPLATKVGGSKTQLD